MVLLEELPIPKGSNFFGCSVLEFDVDLELMSLTKGSNFVVVAILV